jgi:hypothetical protein
MRTVGARNLPQIAPRAFDLAVVGRSGDDPLHPNPKEERSVARPIERIAHRLFTRQVRQHDVEPSLSNRLWADREIRAFLADPRPRRVRGRPRGVRSEPPCAPRR